MDDKRIIVWFSCGAASACALMLARKKYAGGLVPVWPVYCDLSKSESEDNPRFMADVEKWLHARIEVIRSDKFATVDEVFEKTGYMAGIKGARCTVEMK